MVVMQLSFEELKRLNDSEMVDHLLRLAQAKGRSYGRSTIDAWSRHWRSWCAFCDRNRLERAPISLPVISDYLIEAIEQGISKATMANHRLTLRLVHELAGLEFVWTAKFHRSAWLNALEKIEQRQSQNNFAFGGPLRRISPQWVNIQKAGPDAGADEALPSKQPRLCRGIDYVKIVLTGSGESRRWVAIPISREELERRIEAQSASSNPCAAKALQQPTKN
jgi:hypothetical protein